MLIVDACIHHGDNDAVAVVPEFIRSISILFRWTSERRFCSHVVQRRHDILHLDDHNTIEMVDVHQCRNGNFVDNDAIDASQDFEPCTIISPYPTMLIERVGQ